MFKIYYFTFIIEIISECFISFMNFRGGVEFRKITTNSYKSNKRHSHCEKSLRYTKKWKVDSNSARKNQVCSPIKPLAAEKYYNFAGLIIY
jgi:hypothetical protein